LSVQEVETSNTLNSLSVLEISSIKEKESTPQVHHGLESNIEDLVVKGTDCIC